MRHNSRLKTPCNKCVQLPSSPHRCCLIGTFKVQISAIQSRVERIDEQLTAFFILDNLTQKSIALKKVPRRDLVSVPWVLQIFGATARTFCDYGGINRYCRGTRYCRRFSRFHGCECSCKRCACSNGAENNDCIFGFGCIHACNVVKDVGVFANLVIIVLCAVLVTILVVAVWMSLSHATEVGNRLRSHRALSLGFRPSSP